jgi:peroxiredoxin
MTVESTIAGQVAEMHAATAKEPANEVMGAFGREQAELAAAGVPSGIATPGTELADAKLLDVHGEPTSLHAAAGDGPAVLVFYRGVWCPYCNIALSVYQRDLLPRLTERGVRLVAISPQAPDGSLSMRQKHELAFTVLSDPGNRIARDLGILTAPSDEARAAQLELGLDLTAVNADGTTGVPMPTVAILDADHVLRWIDVHPNYATRTEPGEVLAAVDRLGA